MASSEWRTRLTVLAAVLAVAGVVLAPGIVDRLVTTAPALPSAQAAPDPDGFLAGDAVCPAEQGDLVGPDAGPAGAVLADLRDETRRLPGYAGDTVAAADRVVLYWRDPVPPVVRDLAGPRPDGVEVVVAPTAYSASDIASGLALVGSALASGDDAWTAVDSCADSSGLRVEVAASVQDPAGLGADLTAIAAMPVTVVVTDETAAVGR